MLDFCIPLHNSGKLLPPNDSKHIVFSIHSGFVPFSQVYNLLNIFWFGSAFKHYHRFSKFTSEVDMKQISV